MRILVLDDDPSRHDWFESKLSAEDVLHVHGHDEAVRALSSERFDLVFLDHDLDDYRTVNESEAGKTGLEVAEYIASLDASKRPSQVVVHSWNEAGSARMAKTLRAAGIVVRIDPFDDRG